MAGTKKAICVSRRVFKGLLCSVTRVTMICHVDAMGMLPARLLNYVNRYLPLAIIGVRKAVTGSTRPITRLVMPS